jgi:hypothetical protein
MGCNGAVDHTCPVFPLLTLELGHRHRRCRLKAVRPGSAEAYAGADEGADPHQRPGRLEEPEPK